MITTSIALTTIQIVTAIIMVLGLFSLIIPGIPGLTIIWLASLVFMLLTGFSWQAWVVFAFMTLFMLAGNISDNLLMGAGARKQGASWLAIGVALAAGVVGTFLLAAGVVGTFLLPPFGGLVAALVGLFIVEYVRLKDWQKALDSAGSMAMGCGWAVALRFAVGVLMIALWVIWAFLLLK